MPEIFAKVTRAVCSAAILRLIGLRGVRGDAARYQPRAGDRGCRTDPHFAVCREVEVCLVGATVSIGVVIAYDAVLDLSALPAQADPALYRAKDGGRNRVEIALIELLLDRASRRAADPEIQRAAPVRSGAKSAA